MTVYLNESQTQLFCWNLSLNPSISNDTTTWVDWVDSDHP